MYIKDTIDETCWKYGKDPSKGVLKIKLWNYTEITHFMVLCQKFFQIHGWPSGHGHSIFEVKDIVQPLMRWVMSGINKEAIKFSIFPYFI